MTYLHLSCKPSDTRAAVRLSTVAKTRWFSGKASRSRSSSAVERTRARPKRSFFVDLFSYRGSEARQRLRCPLPKGRGLITYFVPSRHTDYLMQIASQMIDTVFKNNYLILTIYRSCLSRLDKLEGAGLQFLRR